MTGSPSRDVEVHLVCVGQGSSSCKVLAPGTSMPDMAPLPLEVKQLNLYYGPRRPHKHEDATFWL